jgi:hypothetical protein
LITFVCSFAFDCASNKTTLLFFLGGGVFGSSGGKKKKNKTTLRQALPGGWAYRGVVVAELQAKGGKPTKIRLRARGPVRSLKTRIAKKKLASFAFIFNLFCLCCTLFCIGLNQPCACPGLVRNLPGFVFPLVGNLQ